ncbi:competence type IV pilus minor pilin ComGF [Litchfieldia alkalitelluris]|uniref:competence type IV pilus minor pilin ComGF n=1 Tax=Litchfieldia alkalitelluris TaxID=304268 RepID=UPI0014764908|nr:competence type IV pilus minor pilin ComGF [Litchfieldia alkalitelluris]
MVIVKGVNSSGFTLIEMLVSLSIVLVIVALFVPVLQVMHEKQKVEMNRMEWEVFYQQTKLEIKESVQIKVTPSILYVTTVNGQVVSYEKYQDKLRRRVNGTGHEIQLQNISSAKFLALPNGVELSVVDLSGKNYNRRFFTYASIPVLQ